jgi:hypothetical protein
MKKCVLMLITFAFILASGAAVAEESSGMRGREARHDGARRHDGLWHDPTRRHDGWWRHDGARSRHACHLRPNGQRR